MPIPPLPPRQPVLSLLVERLQLKVPQWVGLVVLAIALPTGAWMALGDSRGAPPVGPVPLPTNPPLALQSSTWTAMAPTISAVAGRLPDGAETQRKPPCDPDAEEAIGGWCWIPLDVKKCPTANGKAFEHEGKCYLRALRAARAPSSGEPRPSSVAAPD